MRSTAKAAANRPPKSPMLNKTNHTSATTTPMTADEECSLCDTPSEEYDDAVFTPRLRRKSGS